MAPTRTPWIRHLQDDDDVDNGDFDNGNGDDGDGNDGIAEPVTPPTRSGPTEFFDDLAQIFHTIWMCVIWSLYMDNFNSFLQFRRLSPSIKLKLSR